jgi:hypothetical protein
MSFPNMIDSELLFLLYVNYLTAIRKQMARPRKPRSEVRSIVIPVRLTRGELADLRKRAKRENTTVAELLRKGALARLGTIQ